LDQDASNSLSAILFQNLCLLTSILHLEKIQIIFKYQTVFNAVNCCDLCFSLGGIKKIAYRDNTMDKKNESLKGGPHNKATFDELREIFRGVREQLKTAKKLAEDPDKLPDYLEYILVKSGISGIEKAISAMEKNLIEWEKVIWKEAPERSEVKQVVVQGQGKGK
jgi:hypothetical protein